MSKLTRKNIKVFGSNSSNTGTFGSAQAGLGVLTTDIESMQSLSAWSNGMASATIGGQKLLPQEEMEAALRVATYGLANIYQDGIPEYDASTTYYIGSIVKKTGTFELYGSLTNDNVGNALTVEANWAYLGNLLTLGAKLSTSSTASATAEKAVTLSGFVLTTGATIQVTFTNANTAATPILNVNSTGAKAIYNEAGTAVSATNPAYFPAGSTVEFTYNGTYWIFKKRVIENYVNGTSWYRVYSDGWIEQGGRATISTIAPATVTLLKTHKDTNYLPVAQFFGLSSNSTILTCKITDLTTSTFGLYKSSIVDSDYFYWETKGY